MAIVLPLLLATRRAAPAAPAPDSTRLATLRAACDSWNRVRIVSRRGTFEFGSPRFDELGVLVGVPQKRASLLVDRTSQDADPERIHWSDIERIEGTRSHVGRGFAEGAVAGTVVGLSAALLYAAQSKGEDAGTIGLITLGLLFGGLLGATLGGSSGWTALYP